MAPGSRPSRARYDRPIERTGRLDVDGGALFYRESGQGPALLLIHGSAPDSRAWTQVVEHLAEDFRVIAYDRRGYGESPPPRGNGWTEHQADGLRVLREVVEELAYVVGWSGGGYVALHLGAEAPELVHGLMLAETGIGRPPIATPGFLVRVARAQLVRRLHGDRAGMDTLLRWMLPEPEGRNTWDGYPQDARERTYGNAVGMWADFDPRGRPDLGAARLAQVRVPVTILVGEWHRSWFGRSADAFEKALPDTRRVTLGGTNHALGFHQPAAFADAIRTAAAAALTT